MSGKKGTTRTASPVLTLVHNPALLEKGIKSFSAKWQDGDEAYTRRYLLALGLSRATALVRYAKTKKTSKCSKKKG